MNTYGAGYGIAALFALLLMAAASLTVLVLAGLSWKWSRPGASFRALAFPLVLPLCGMVFCAAYPNISVVWIGFWTVTACGILGRAIWMRPSEEGRHSSVRRRQRDILLSTVGIGILYSAWAHWTFVEAARSRQRLETHLQHDAEDRAQKTAVWSEGRIVTSAGDLCYSRDGRFLAAAAEDLEIWNLTTGKLHHHFRKTTGKSYTNLQFDGDGTHLAVSVNHEVEVYDIEQKQGPITLLAAPQKWLNQDNHLCFLDRQNAIVVLQEGTAHAFQVDTGKPLPLPLPALQQPDIQAFAISRDNEWQATWSSGRKQIAVWRTGGSEPVWTAGNIEARRSPDLLFSSDGHWLALTTQQGSIVVWNAITGVEQTRLNSQGEIKSFRFSEDSQQLVAVQKESFEPQVSIWNVSTGHLKLNGCNSPAATRRVKACTGRFQPVLVGFDSRRSVSNRH